MNTTIVWWKTVSNISFYIIIMQTLSLFKIGSTGYTVSLKHTYIHLIYMCMYTKMNANNKLCILRLQIKKNIRYNEQRHDKFEKLSFTDEAV